MLAILLAVFAIGYVGIIPAQAANRDTKTETVVTYRGYTLSWSEPDASDLRVVRTPGRSESLPDAAIMRSIQQAKSRVSSAAQQQASNESSTDSCNFVPDSFGLADFTSACHAHDDCYSALLASRLNCDLAFLANLNQACWDAYPDQPAPLVTCFTVASIYFVGVRLFGAPFYNSNPVVSSY
jgi:hypothetical protein